MRLSPLVLAAVLPVLVAGCDDGAGTSAAKAASPARTATVTASPSPGASPDLRDPSAWRDDVLVALRPLTGVTVEMLRAVEAWRADPTLATSTRALLGRYAEDLAAAQQAVDRHVPLAAAPHALDDYRLTTALYLQAARVGIASTSQPDGPLRTELLAQFSRLRVLADRFFDEGEAAVTALLPARPPIAGVELRRAAEVPDWAATGLAAGPPLDTRPARTAPREYVERRPTQPFARWQAAVLALRLPSGEQERAVLAGSDEAALRQLARALTTASSALYGTADPAGERTTSIRLQLGLLVHAEAARAAQAAVLSGPAQQQLRAVSQALAALGDRTWDRRLGPRSTGLRA